MTWSFFLFFFFKQKTAYEMRISDWSSDVCSSDLPPVSGQPDEAVEDALGARLLEFDLQLVAVDVEDRAIAEFLVEDAHADREVGAWLRADRCGGGALGQIGRAHV